MTNVYANCLLNISVAHASSLFDGCFVQRLVDRSKVLPCVRWRPGPADHEAMYQLSSDHMDEHEKLRRHAIFDRAWVLQERLFSPRVLHFGSKQVYWECSGKKPVYFACENFLDGAPLGAEDFEALPFDLHSTQDSAELSELWTDLVYCYAEMSLTQVHKDKFVALGGVAERVGHFLGDQYVVGMFRHTLVSQLC